MAKTAGRSDALTIETRERAGTTAANRIRQEGKIPGVLYGHGESTPIALDARALETLITSGGKSHIIDATIGGKHDSVLLREVQRDPVTYRPIHVDFQRVTKGEAVTATIPIVTTGVSKAVKDGAVMDVVTRQIDVKGPADKIPENITIDVTDIPVMQHVSAGDLKLPPGFTLITPPDSVILSIEASRTAQLAEEAAVAAPAPAAEEAAPAAPTA